MGERVGVKRRCRVGPLQTSRASWIQAQLINKRLLSGMAALTILHYFPTPLPGSTLGRGLSWPLLTSVFFPSCQGSVAD